MEKQDFTDFKNYIQAANTRGCTDFVKCFKWMDDFCQQNKNSIEELTVIFFTDGLDNCNKKDVIRSQFEILKQKVSGIQSKFLSIGFSQNHDADLMNFIAMGGSQVGNFSYIDTRQNDYEQKVKDSLAESLDIAMEGSNALKLNLASEEQGIDVSHKLETNFEFGEEEIDGMPVIDKVVLSCQAIVKTEEIEGLQAYICGIEVRIQFGLSMEKVNNPSDDVMLKAQLKSANMKIFDLI